MFMQIKAELNGDKITEGVLYDLSEDCEQAQKQAEFIRGKIHGEWTTIIGGRVQKLAA